MAEPTTDTAAASSTTLADVQSVLYPTDKPADTAAVTDDAAKVAAVTDDAAKVAAEADAAKTPEQLAADKEAADKEAADKAAADKAKAVPEKYEFKAPDGITLDPAQVEAFTPIAKELGLTNEQAQKLVDFQASQTKAAVDAFHAQKATWLAEAKADKDFGGAKFDESVGFARNALDKFGTPSLRVLLEDSGLGNHPAVIGFCYQVGKAIAEDKMTLGSNGGGDATKTVAQILYPNLK